jgi:hypothetical protein
LLVADDFGSEAGVCSDRNELDDSSSAVAVTPLRNQSLKELRSK